VTVTVRTDSPAATADLGAAVAELLRPCDLVLLCGDMGTGKTAFTKGVGRGLGVLDPITSPTFTLVRSYPGRLLLHHLDVYRLTQLDEVLELGLSELLDDDAVTLIEWGDQILAALGPDYLEVRIELGAEDDDRLFAFTPRGSRWSARRRALAVSLAAWTVEADEATDDPSSDDRPGDAAC